MFSIGFTAETELCRRRSTHPAQEGIFHPSPDLLGPEVKVSVSNKIDSTENPLLSEGRRSANGAESATSRVTRPVVLGFPNWAGHPPRQVEHLFKRGVSVGQHIYSAGR